MFLNSSLYLPSLLNSDSILTLCLHTFYPSEQMFEGGGGLMSQLRSNFLVVYDATKILYFFLPNKENAPDYSMYEKDKR